MEEESVEKYFSRRNVDEKKKIKLTNKGESVGEKKDKTRR
jgi:hypothetical protein